MNDSRTHRRLSGRVALCLAVAMSLACKAKEAEFYRKAFACDLNAAPDTCGTTSDGKPMTCYAGHILGGQDFCTATCDPAAIPTDSRFACLDSGSLLQRCRPVAGRDDPAYRCPEGLECYRTDLLVDDGLCLMMHVCTEDKDCTGTRICAGTLIRKLSASHTLHLASDGLMCIQSTCETQGSNCLPDEACLFNSYTSGPALPDICVPKCDSKNLQCPPNFVCAQSELAPGSPALCLPGLPGVRCRTNQDCIVGDCVDAGPGLRICTLPIPCRPNDFCSELNVESDVFVCAEGIPGQPRCVTARAFGGGTCVDSGECAGGTGQQCSWYSPLSALADRGTCRLPCDANGRCLPSGGIPFVCLGENHEGGCNPTNFGYPCLDDSECYDNLSCALVGPDARSKSNYNPRICTTPCTNDAECDANPLTYNKGFCQAQTGFCRHSGPPGSPCTQDTHCMSRRCNGDAGCQ